MRSQNWNVRWRKGGTVSDRPLSADLHEHWNDVFSWVTIHGRVVAGWEERAAALEAEAAKDRHLAFVRWLELNELRHAIDRARDLCDEACACEEGRTCTACRIKAELERRGA